MKMAIFDTKYIDFLHQRIMHGSLKVTIVFFKSSLKITVNITGSNFRGSGEIFQT